MVIFRKDTDRGGRRLAQSTNGFVPRYNPDLTCLVRWSNRPMLQAFAAFAVPFSTVSDVMFMHLWMQWCRTLEGDASGVPTADRVHPQSPQSPHAKQITAALQLASLASTPPLPMHFLGMPVHRRTPPSARPPGSTFQRHWHGDS